MDHVKLYPHIYKNTLCHHIRKTILMPVYHPCYYRLHGLLQMSLSKRFKMVLLASSGELYLLSEAYFCPFQTDDRFLTTSSSKTNLSST